MSRAGGESGCGEKDVGAGAADAGAADAGAAVSWRLPPPRRRRKSGNGVAFYDGAQVERDRAFRIYVAPGLREKEG